MAACTASAASPMESKSVPSMSESANSALRVSCGEFDRDRPAVVFGGGDGDGLRGHESVLRWFAGRVAGHSGRATRAQWSHREAAGTKWRTPSGVGAASTCARLGMGGDARRATRASDRSPQGRDKRSLARCAARERGPEGMRPNARRHRCGNAWEPDGTERSRRLSGGRCGRSRRQSCAARCRRRWRSCPLRCGHGCMARCGAKCVRAPQERAHERRHSCGGSCISAPVPTLPSPARCMLLDTGIFTTVGSLDATIVGAMTVRCRTSTRRTATP